MQAETVVVIVQEALSVGRLGVDFFFCLSSFLITYLLLKEQSRNSYSQIRFIMRRILRIWPLYFLVVIAGFGLVPALADVFSYDLTLPPLLPFLLFYSNFYMAVAGVAFFFPLTFLWTIAIEEQFYMTWSFVFRWSRKALWITLGVLMLLHFTSKILEWHSYFNPLTYLPYFVFGAIIAINQERLSKVPGYFKALLWIVVVSSVFLNHQLFDEGMAVYFEQSYYALLFALMIGLHTMTSIPNFLKPFAYLGRVSYGLYLWHGFILVLITFIWTYFGLVESLSSTLLWKPLLELLITISIASLSYQWIERPFLRIKNTIYQPHEA